ncbi:alpha/beta fold hydrolase [Armatimonas sp.]|uniref:alpha/beta hydrolase n=1 Tax=Armatimonas sp. TaxID=1872638 RepID=UPI00286C083E|nr:alpha/beta fold hydrolase [Armatimonas sp.]
MSFSLIHRVRQAEGARPPLLVLLHGVGSHEEDLFGLSPWLDPRYTVVSARAPLRHGGGWGWYPITFHEEGIEFEEDVAFESAETLERFIQECHRHYGTDPTQTVLMGFSQGAAMALLLLLTRPECLHAAVLMSGRLIPEAAVQAAHYMQLVGKPVFVTHGLYDSVLPIDQGRAIQAELKRYPVLMTYKEYPMGHEVSPQSITDIQTFLTNLLDDEKET